MTIKGEVRRDGRRKSATITCASAALAASPAITLPLPVDADKVEATHENSILISLRLPKTEAVKPKKISVKKMIAGNRRYESGVTSPGEKVVYRRPG